MRLRILLSLGICLVSCGIRAFPVEASEPSSGAKTAQNNQLQPLPLSVSVEENRSSMRANNRLRFASANLSKVRDLSRHQPRYFYDSITHARCEVWQTNSYTIMANPEKFDGKVVTFTGYLKKTSHGCCPGPGDECYHIFMTPEDIDRSWQNYVHLRVNSQFFEGNNFPDGSLVEAEGLLKAGVVGTNEGLGRSDSTSHLLNGSMRILEVFDPATLSRNKVKVAEYQDLVRRGIDPWNPFMSYSAENLTPNFSWEIRAKLFSEAGEKVVAEGGVMVSIDDQDAELHADKVIYDRQARILNAVGDVKIVRQGHLSTGQEFKFKIDSNEYLVTQPEVILGPVFLQVWSSMGDNW